MHRFPSGAATAFTATAIDEGQWANSVYGIRIVAIPVDSTRFSLLVVYTPVGGQETTVESFANLSIDPSDTQGRSVASVVNDPRTGSQIIQISGVSANQPTPNPLTIPAGTGPYAFTGGIDGTVLVPGVPIFTLPSTLTDPVPGASISSIPYRSLTCCVSQERLPLP